MRLQGLGCLGGGEGVGVTERDEYLGDIRSVGSKTLFSLAESQGVSGG